eukprot:2401674-Rhodomonas_salina.1
MVFLAGGCEQVNDVQRAPLQLDMAPFLSDSGRKEADLEGGCIYDLLSVLVHSGTAAGGHYYCYVRDLIPRNGGGKSGGCVQKEGLGVGEWGAWYHFNDAYVTRVE